MAILIEGPCLGPPIFERFGLDMALTFHEEGLKKLTLLGSFLLGWFFFLIFFIGITLDKIDKNLF